MHACKDYMLFLATMSLCAWLLCSQTREGTLPTLINADGLIKPAFGKKLYALHEIQSNIEVESGNRVTRSMKKYMALRKLLQKSPDCTNPGGCSKGTVLVGATDQTREAEALSAPKMLESERIVPGGPDTLPLYRSRMPKSKNATLDSARLVPGGPDPLPLDARNDVPQARRANPPPTSSTAKERGPVPTIPPISSEISRGALQPGSILVSERLVPTGPDPLHHSANPQYKIPPKRPANCSAC